MATRGRCNSITVTPDGGTALVADGPVSCKPIDDDEIVEKQYGDSRQKSVFGGGAVKGISITVTDQEFMAALVKGTRITTAVVVMEECYDADGTILSATTETVTLTGGYVANDAGADSSTDGSPSDFTFELMLCRGKDGTEGSLAYT